MIDLFRVRMDPAAKEAVGRVLDSDFIGQGPRVEEFEARLRDHLKTPYCTTVNSATAGLTLALRLIKEDGAQDEVLTTPLTCFATTAAVLAAGLKPRWVDVNPATGNMDVTDLARKLSPRTLAVLVVHWGGYPCDLNELRGVCGGTPIVEDCAHAWGAVYDGRPVGTSGNYCVFSFGAIKHLTCGDGGLLVTGDKPTYERSKLLRWYGLDRTSNNDFRCQQDIGTWGYKFHMTDINAVIGTANLAGVAQAVERHKQNGRHFDRALRDVPGVTLMECKDDRESAYWVYTLRVRDRDGFTAKMTGAGIAVSRVHARNDKHSCLADARTPLPGLDRLSQEIICVPCGWWLTDEDRDHVVSTIRSGW